MWHMLQRGIKDIPWQVASVLLSSELVAEFICREA